MIVEQTHIEDLLILSPAVHGDERGYFMESYSDSTFLKNDLKFDFIQDNEAKSGKGVLRGLHFQNPPYAQTKLIRAISGEILDVAVDLRKNSKTFKQVFSIRLSSANKKQLLVPKGFAHGYIVLSDEAIVAYKVDEIYAPQSESGIIWNDPELNIDWVLDESAILLSGKDKLLTSVEHLNSPFV